MTTILKGNIIAAPSPGRLDVTENGYLIAENGVITGVYPVLPEQYAGAAVEDCGDALIVQSFADLHLHGAQYPMLGMGMDRPLLDWLNAYAFPTEARFADPDYARTVYRQLAQELAAHGTTRVCMFSSLHTDATLIRAMEEQGIGRPSTYAPTVSTILDREYVVKEGKYLHITNLGRVVTQLMEERFSDIADLKFTANMEKKLDDVEEGTVNWKSVLRDFYGDFEENLKKAEKDLEGVYIKVPDEVSEEICPVCGRNLVVKSGRFGRFLACPGFPECNFTMPLVVEMPGRCPKCGGRLFKRTGTSRKSGKQYTYYCCEHTNNRVAGGATCDFMTWDVPVKDDCPVCGKTMFKRAGKGYKRPYCINPECANFLPEDKRGYPKKQVEASANAEEAPGESDAPAEEKPAKKTAAKKTATKTAAKKTTVKKTAKKAEDGDAEKKPAAKKAAVKKAVAKTTTKKTTTKKTTKKAETTKE